MRRFIRNTAFFSILPISLIVLSFFLANGTTDPFYLRFTTPKQASLILGTSRAAQALQPQIIDSVLNKNGIAAHLFNYSFTLAHSPYGPVYYEAIKRKLDETAKNGIYIIAVDPWSISSKSKVPNDSAAFGENRLCLGTTKAFTGSPNIDYLLNSYSKPLFSIYFDKVKNLFRKPSTVLHKDGWLEVTVSMESANAEARLKKMINDYTVSFVPYYHFSSLRFSYLEKTVDLLRQHGTCYLVRLPIDTTVRQMDEHLVPGFDTMMASLARQKNIEYINYTQDSEKFLYTDGNHLYKSSGTELSQMVAEAIVNFKRKRPNNTSIKPPDKAFLTAN